MAQKEAANISYAKNTEEAANISYAKNTEAANISYAKNTENANVMRYKNAPRPALRIKRKARAKRSAASGQVKVQKKNMVIKVRVQWQLLMTL